MIRKKKHPFPSILKSIAARWLRIILNNFSPSHLTFLDRKTSREIPVQI
jgi:hypothetical protein